MADATFLTDPYTCESGVVAYQTPLWLPNGDGICVYVREDGDRFIVNDGRQAWTYLHQRPIRITPKRLRTLERIAAANSAGYGEGLFSDGCVADTLEDAACRIAQCVLQASVIAMTDP